MAGEGGSGGFPSATDGNVEVDSNTGTADDLARELATETAVVDEQGRRGSKPAEAAAVPADGEEFEDGEDAGGAPPAAKVVDGVKPGEKKKGRSLQARIDDITRDKYKTARERDEAFAERDRLRSELASLKAGKPTEEKPAAAKVPTGEKVGGVQIDAEKFPKYAEWLSAGNDGDLEDWVDARDTWKETRATRAAEVQAERVEHSRQFTQVASTFNERMAPHLETEPEFYERIDPRLTETPAMSALPKGAKPTMGNFLVEQVVRSEFPKELMEHLSDKKVIRRLVTLQPNEIVREIARFELTLGEPPAKRSAGPGGRATPDEDDEESDEDSDARSAADATPISRAHPPAKPVRGSSHQHRSPDVEPGDDASDDEWFRWNRKQAAKASA